MPYFTLKDIVASSGVSRPTVKRRMKDFGFKKKTPGHYYSEKEIEQISKLLNITIQLHPKG